MTWLFPSFQFQWLAEEARKNLPRELDFQQEAHNQERFAAMFSHLDFVKVGENSSQSIPHIPILCFYLLNFCDFIALYCTIGTPVTHRYTIEFSASYQATICNIQ